MCKGWETLCKAKCMGKKKTKKTNNFKFNLIVELLHTEVIYTSLIIGRIEVLETYKKNFNKLSVLLDYTSNTS